MKKIILFISSGIMLVYIIYILPAFSYSKLFFISKYNPNLKEQVIILDIYDKMHLPTTISLWVSIAIYLLLIVMYFVKGGSDK
jgi:hypothetical protein